MNRDPIFTDAGFWVALRDSRDLMHPQALRLAERLIRERIRLVITPLVFAEVYAQFSRRRPLREQFIRDTWENPVVHVEQPTFEDQENALKILRAHSDKSFSFSDAVSFVVMTRLKIPRAISFDAHFRQYGKFEIVESDTDV